MSRSTILLGERTATEKLEKAEFEARQARTYLKERDWISKEDPTPENLSESRAAFLKLKECEELLWWMRNEISNQRRQR
jgi:hypothetical protein